MAPGALAQDRKPADNAAPVDPAPRPPALDGRFTLDIPTDRPIRIEQARGGGPSPWIPPAITGLVALLTSIIALIATLTAVGRTNRQNAANTAAALDKASENARLAINQKSNELEITWIEKWLSDFFGPFIQLSKENELLADQLRSRQADQDFRTLRALLDPKWKKGANQTDLRLVDQIVENGLLLRTLIREKAGPVAPVLQAVLAKASAHFTILDLANRGLLTHDTETFGAHVYPRELDGILEAERDRLEDRRDLLRANLSAGHPPIADLTAPSASPAPAQPAGVPA